MIDRYDQELLLDYLEGELDEDRRAQLDKALADDPELANLLAAMSGDRDLLRALPREEAPPNLAHDATQSIERSMLLDDEPAGADAGPIPISRGRGLAHPPASNRNWARIGGLTALAASVAIVAGVLVVQFGQNNDPLQQTADSFGDSNANDDNQNPDLTPNTLGQKDDPDDHVSKESLVGKDGAQTDTKDLVNDPAVAAKKPAGAGIDGENKDGKTADPAAGPVVALARNQPTQHLLLMADQQDNTDQALTRVITYCLDNNIPIVKIAGEMAGDENGYQRRPEAASFNYTLLITRDKLDALVKAINKDTAPSDLQLGSGKQVALLTKLTTTGGATPNVGTAKSAIKQADEPSADQPVQLYLPGKLPSPKQMSDNINNIEREVSRNKAAYLRYDSKPEKNAPGAEASADGAAEGATPDKTEQDKTAQDKGMQDKYTPSKKAANVDTPKSKTKDAKDAGKEIRQSSPKRAAPQPGNALEPHLPLADTTSLDQLQAESDDKAPLVVPITIKPADAELIAKLRAAQLKKSAQTQAGDQEPGAQTDETAKDSKDAKPDAPSPAPDKPAAEDGPAEGSDKAPAEDAGDNAKGE